MGGWGIEANDGVYSKLKRLNDGVYSKLKRLNDGVYSWKTLRKHSLLWMNRFGRGYFTSRKCLGSIKGFEGERISTPLAVEYFRAGQAVLILTSSRKQSLRKFRTVI